MMEKYPHDLKTLLNKKKKKLNVDAVVYKGRNILFTIGFIHSKEFVHAEIKSSNIMFNNKNEVILID
jgi:serine/threonine protein kinase